MDNNNNNNNNGLTMATTEREVYGDGGRTSTERGVLIGNVQEDSDQQSIPAIAAAQSKHFINLRPPVKPPVAEALISSPSSRQRPPHRIRFRHPQYPDGSNILLDLFAPDHPSGGLQYSFANVACGIIAGNRWDGAFSETLDGPLLRFDPHEILLSTNYYYHLSDSTHENPYPIVPTFREWSFPHDHLPEPWSSLTSRPDSPSLNRTHAISSLYPALLSRDASCRISACEEATQAAYIIPQAEDDWFQRNEMFIYNANAVAIGSRSCDDTGNALLLRADLHILFDAAKFIFVPKTPAPKPKAGQETLPPQPELVTHLIVNSTELQMLYHNTRLQPLGAVSPEFLLARFAWALFPNMTHFLRRGMPRRLTGATITADGALGKWFDAQECQSLLGRPSKSRSASPQKRSRARDDSYELGNMSAYDGLSRSKRQRRDSYSGEDSSSTASTTDTDDLPTTPENDICTSPAKKSTTSAPQPAPNLERLRHEWLAKERLRSNSSVAG